MIREGYIEKIIFRNEENGYAVFNVETVEGDEIFVGTLPQGGEGMFISAEGETKMLKVDSASSRRI